jgi:hypothetical protein
LLPDPRRQITIRQITILCRHLSSRGAWPLAVRVRLDPFVEPERVEQTGYEADHKRDQDGRNFPFAHVSVSLSLAENFTRYADNVKMTMPYKQFDD